MPTDSTNPWIPVRMVSFMIVIVVAVLVGSNG